ncbi:HAD family hydrolase [Streptomyces sulphureus]|uniref:HAD family hydrolase n=1 Tax=Streptomyces sulphureus TaxID=47758 RepID=UPI0003701C42|nr:HAD hydrolase-like protein [Streptomyces sulphureus]
MRDLLDTAKCVLLVLEGPVCRLFSPTARRELATALDDLVRAAGHPPLAREDPYETLRAALAEPTLRRDGTADQVAAAVERAEHAAAPLAFPAPYSDTLLHTLVATGRRPAVVTDVGEEAAARYLDGRRLGHLLAGHLHGRRGTGPLMPHPGCVARALEAAGVHAADALLVGGTPKALEAAEAAGVPFLGCARGDEEREALTAAGAERSAASLREVVQAIDPGAHV